MTFKDTNGAVTFAVRVVPRASKNEIAGFAGDAIKVRLNAPPVEGRANDALVNFLAETLNVSRAQIEIVRGETSRTKSVRVRGIRAEQVKMCLEQKTAG